MMFFFPNLSSTTFFTKISRRMVKFLKILILMVGESFDQARKEINR